jgi:mannose/fructose/N-acetylgalactosamine-specific phosphotransferase system component IID
MYLVAIAWIYVVLMMAVAEAISPQGTVLGAIFTFLLYGALPLSIVMYLLRTPHRRRMRRAREEEEALKGQEGPPAQ